YFITNPVKHNYLNFPRDKTIRGTEVAALADTLGHQFHHIVAVPCRKGTHNGRPYGRSRSAGVPSI
ncbi:MAG: hypothetical protein KAR21_08725, partial [Spirochaetales bacterium]|nr:hypothetical protein [Spirochaetales bacterium]